MGPRCLDRCLERLVDLGVQISQGDFIWSAREGVFEFPGNFVRAVEEEGHDG